MLQGIVQSLQEFRGIGEHRFCVRHLYSNFKKKIWRWAYDDGFNDGSNKSNL